MDTSSSFLIKIQPKFQRQHPSQNFPPSRFPRDFELFPPAGVCGAQISKPIARVAFLTIKINWQTLTILRVSVREKLQSFFVCGGHRERPAKVDVNKFAKHFGGCFWKNLGSSTYTRGKWAGKLIDFFEVSFFPTRCHCRRGVKIYRRQFKMVRKLLVDGGFSQP